MSAVSPQVLPERLRRYARQTGVSRAAKGVARRLGVDVIRRHYYSPIPDVPGLPHEVWTRESELRGVKLDIEAGLEFVQRKLACASAEYTPPQQPTSSPRDSISTTGSMARSTRSCCTRWFGTSSRAGLSSWEPTLNARHCGRAGAQPPRGLRPPRTDPFPPPELTEVVAEIAELQRVSATEIPLQEFLLLEAGDLLLVDTTHAVKIGSDVNRIILDVLPALAPVFAHFHDIFLPWEYPAGCLTSGSSWRSSTSCRGFSPSTTSSRSSCPRTRCTAVTRRISRAWCAVPRPPRRRPHSGYDGQKPRSESCLRADARRVPIAPHSYPLGYRRQRNAS